MTLNNLNYQKYLLKLPSGEFPTTFIKPSDSIGKLAVVLPGANYSCRMPLLYYSIQVLLKNGFDVLTIDKTYSEDSKWCELNSMESALNVVEEDSNVLFKQIIEKIGCEIHTVLGRSLGTYAMACALMNRQFQPKQLIWQTPSLNGKWEIIKSCGIKGFCIIGTCDDRFEMAKPYLNESTLIIEKADHGMEIPGDPIMSVGVLQQIIKATDEWVN